MIPIDPTRLDARFLQRGDTLVAPAHPGLSIQVEAIDPALGLCTVVIAPKRTASLPRAWSAQDWRLDAALTWVTRGDLLVVRRQVRA